MNQDRIKEYYSHEIELDRLETAPFKLEGIRTKEIIDQLLLSKTIINEYHI
jgi:hypothetical protein